MSFENVQQCLLAVITRNFASKHFQLHLLIPRIPGVPSEAKLKLAGGEAQNCRLDRKTG